MFVTQGPVPPDSPLFTGRASELKKMESWLSDVNCVGALLGARQTGKTSLLLRLRHTLQGKYAFAFVNLQAIEGARVDECFRYIAEQMTAQLTDVLHDDLFSLPEVPKSFLSFLQQFTRRTQAVRVIVILDEIGALPSDTAIKLASTIRAVFTNRFIQTELARYVFVLAGATDMLELTTGLNSPLQNVTDSIYLDDFSPAETDHLLAEAFKDTSVRPSSIISHHVHNWTGGHPYWTQLIASALENQSEVPTDETLRGVVEDLLRTENRNLPHVVRLLDTDKTLWNLVESLLNGDPLSFSRANATVAKLELVGVLKNREGRCVIRNKIYQEAIRRQLNSLESNEPPTIPVNHSPNEDVYVGMLLDERYFIEKELGRGGMGVVYLARDTRLLNRQVVIKILGEDSHNDPWFRKKFRQEMEALSRIDHPGVVGVLDVGQTPGKKTYLVMQYVEGVTLRSLIPNEGMDLGRAANIMRQLGHALNAAHEKGVWHHDLKPANIMLQTIGGEEHVKIIDFGIAKVKDSQVPSQEPTKVAGTLPYLAPEQLQGTPSAASDIYVLGIIAHEMVTGRRPFNSSSQHQLLEMQREGVRVKPSVLRPNLPEEAEKLILKALTFNPGDRYVQPRDFSDPLARALLSVNSGPRNKRRDRRAAFLLIAISAILLLGFGAVFAWKSFTPRPVISEQIPPTATISERILSYSITVQKYRDGQPFQKPFELADEIVFERDYRIRLNIDSVQPGYLYVINQGPVPENGLPSFVLLFPSPTSNAGSPKLGANQRIRIPEQSEIYFDSEEGIEKLWLVWSSQSVAPLEAVKGSVNPQDKGIIRDPGQIRTVEEFLKQNSAAKPQVTKDEQNRQTVLKGKGDMLVHVMKLEHH